MEQTIGNERFCTVRQTVDLKGPTKNSFHTPPVLDTLLDERQT